MTKMAMITPTCQHVHLNGVNLIIFNRRASMKELIFKVADAAGLHARPAAELARFTSTLSSDVSIGIKNVEEQADAKSMIGIMSLGVHTGDEVHFLISGNTECADFRRLQEFCEVHLG